MRKAFLPCSGGAAVGVGSFPPTKFGMLTELCFEAGESPACLATSVEVTKQPMRTNKFRPAGI